LRAQASSGSHPEGCGLGDSGSPRAASARLPIRRKGVRAGGRASLNQRRSCSSGLEAECDTGLAARGASWRRGDGTACTGAPGATATLRGWDGFGGSSSRVLVREARCEGSAPRARSSRLRSRRFRRTGRAAQAASVRGGREPGGVRHAECTGIGATEAGDGLTAMPLLILRSPRERLASNERLRNMLW